jgi:hypothetical protein
MKLESEGFFKKSCLFSKCKWILFINLFVWCLEDQPSPNETPNPSNKEVCQPGLNNSDDQLNEVESVRVQDSSQDGTPSTGEDVEDETDKWH